VLFLKVQVERPKRNGKIQMLTQIERRQTYDKIVAQPIFRKLDTKQKPFVFRQRAVLYRLKVLTEVANVSNIRIQLSDHYFSSYYFVTSQWFLILNVLTEVAKVNKVSTLW